MDPRQGRKLHGKGDRQPGLLQGHGQAEAEEGNHRRGVKSQRYGEVLLPAVMRHPDGCAQGDRGEGECDRRPADIDPEILEPPVGDDQNQDRRRGGYGGPHGGTLGPPEGDERADADQAAEDRPGGGEGEYFRGDQGAPGSTPMARPWN